MSVLLALFGARVAGDEPCSLETGSEFGIEFDQSASHTVPHCARLSGESAAFDVHENVEFACGIREVKRLADYHTVHFILKIIFELPLVDDDLPCAGLDENPRSRALAPTGSIVLIRLWHYLLSFKSVSHVHRLRLLSLVRMTGAFIDLELFDHPSTHLRLGQHACDCRFEYALRMFLKLLFG